MDLQEIFAAVLNMTATGTIVIGCVLGARLALGKAPRVFAWLLWLAVIFRLLCPVSVPGPASVLELVDAPRSGNGTVVLVELPTQAPAVTAPVPNAAPAAPVQGEAAIDWSLAAARVWCAGAGLLLVYGAFSYVNLKRRLQESVPAERGVREGDGIGSPFVLGRTVYLPAGLAEEERTYILLHERLHIRYGDPFVKGLFWLAVCVHWFNPAVWLAFALCGRDMELRCDEAVLKKLGPQVRSDYAQSLLSCAAGRRFAPAPLAFGEGDASKRVRFVLNWKRRKRWIAALAAVLCITVLVLTLCNPAAYPAQKQQVFGKQYRAEAVLGRGVSPERIYFVQEFDENLCWQEGETVTDLGKLIPKRLGSGFDLSDEVLERQLRRENDAAWKTGEYWLLFQKDRSIYLTEGKDRVLKLDRVRRIDVRAETALDFGSRYGLAAYPAGSVQWEQVPAVTVGDGATLVFTQSGGEKTLTVYEEYHQMAAGGGETVTEQVHTLDITRDYGYELPVVRRGETGGDWALYRIDLGLSSYAIRVCFGAGVSLSQTAVYSEHGAGIVLQLPEGWSYSVTSVDAEELNAGIAGGISFWPAGREEGKIFFGYYPDRFGVCGTGLETETMTLAGQTVSVGTYDGGAVWDFISFEEHFAVWGQGHEAWWAEYGQQAMAILDTARFGIESSN